MLDFQTRILYDLKRQYGQPVGLYEQQISSPDLRNGTLNTIQVVHNIPLAIVLSPKFFTKGIYGTALLKAGRQFSYGAFLNIDTKIVILDRLDLPIDIDISLANHVVLKGTRFEIDSFEELENDLGYILAIKRVTGVTPQEVHTECALQTFRIAQQATYTLN